MYMLNIIDNILVNDDFNVKYYSIRIESSLFKNPYGIHGVNHAKRVLILCNCLLYLLDDKNIENKIILSLASIYHDIGRKYDSNYKSHGKSSWRKIEQLKLLLDEEDQIKETVKYIIENHSVDDGETNIETYHIVHRSRAKYLYNIFKDADALDRIRIGDLDTSLLRIKESKNLQNLANYLLYNIDKMNI